MDKIKVYLDTNQIQDFFVNQAVALKRKEEPKTPEKLKFLLECRENKIYDKILSYIELRKLIVSLSERV